MAIPCLNCGSRSINFINYFYPLQCAIRKYGVENFTFEILKNDFNDVNSMETYEHQMILKYNSLCPNGYNQTENTKSNIIALENTQKHIKKISKKCALVNEQNEIISIYSSYHEAARAQGWDGDKRATTIKKICDGEAHSCNNLIFRSLDENNNVIIPKAQTRKRRTKIKGININNPNDIVYYDSISEAARKEKVDRSSLSKCLAGSSRYSKVGGRKWERIGD